MNLLKINPGFAYEPIIASGKIVMYYTTTQITICVKVAI